MRCASGSWMWGSLDSNEAAHNPRAIILGCYIGIVSSANCPEFLLHAERAVPEHDCDVAAETHRFFDPFGDNE